MAYLVWSDKEWWLVFFTPLESRLGLPFYIFLESQELYIYMPVHTIEWWIGQYLLGLDRSKWDQVVDHFLKGLRDFHAYFHEVYFHSVFGPYTFMVG